VFKYVGSISIMMELNVYTIKDMLLLMVLVENVHLVLLPTLQKQPVSAMTPYLSSLLAQIVVVNLSQNSEVNWLY
jgi:hypothetical protein